ncbi:hypothetical protein CLOM_g1648 [Closterium sp. NIES-68]|nr:hypothetical protein CLOM_g1648 [Closterium sp. NIES-68]GJP76620.1 hypothetical protein CLOP_g7038 [Closterium sp. NIES-67]
MEASEKVAIVRFKLTNRADSGVAIGALTPWCRGRRGFSEVEDVSVPDLLVFNTLPFSEDIREFSFPSLQAAPANQQPTPVQSSAAAALVQAMSLGRRNQEGEEYREKEYKQGKEAWDEKLRPDDTPSPALQHYYNFIRTRILNPKAPLPPLPPSLDALLSHPLSTDHPAAQSFAAAFPALADRTAPLSQEPVQASQQAEPSQVEPALVAPVPPKPGFPEAKEQNGEPSTGPSGVTSTGPSGVTSLGH